LNFNPDSPKTVLNEWRWLQWVGYFLLCYYLKIKPGFISKKQAVGIFLFGFISSGVMCLVARHQMLFNPDNNLFAQLANISLDYSAPGVVLMSIGSWLLLVRTNFLFLKKRIWQLVANVGASLSLGIYVFHGVVYLYLDVFRRLGLDNMIFWHRPAFALIGLTILTIMISALITFTLGLFPAFRMLIGNDKKWPFLSDIK